jgi:ecotin
MKFNLHVLATALAMVAGVLSLSACASAANGTDGAVQAAARELHAFPAMLDGYRRYVIELPAKAHEDERKLELIGGKEMTVDCNARGMDGQFEARDVKGWGYTYWVLQSRGNVLSTMMACPPGSSHPGFVQAPPLLVRYNSKLPVVVFVPDGMVLRYRIWRAGTTKKASAQ